MRKEVPTLLAGIMLAMSAKAFSADSYPKTQVPSASPDQTDQRRSAQSEEKGTPRNTERGNENQAKDFSGQADYEAEVERCGTFVGAEKSACINTAKKKAGQM